MRQSLSFTLASASPVSNSTQFFVYRIPVAAYVGWAASGFGCHDLGSLPAESLWEAFGPSPMATTLGDFRLFVLLLYRIVHQHTWSTRGVADPSCLWMPTGVFAKIITAAHANSSRASKILLYCSIEYSYDQIHVHVVNADHASNQNTAADDVSRKHFCFAALARPTLFAQERKNCLTLCRMPLSCPTRSTALGVVNGISRQQTAECRYHYVKYATTCASVGFTIVLKTQSISHYGQCLQDQTTTEQCCPIPTNAVHANPPWLAN